MSLTAPRKVFDFPKAELHCHIDGTYDLSSIIEMAKERDVELPSYDPIILSRLICNLRRCESLDEYLEIFKIVGPTFAGNLANIERLAKESVIIKARYGVKYVELRYAPHFLLDENSEKNGITINDAVQAICTGLKKGCEEVKTKWNKDIVAKSILCSIITFPVSMSMEVVHLCKEFSDQGVVGFDIAGAGDEEGQMILKHKEAYMFCKENGIGRTAHAGEKGSSHEVKVAVEQLGVTRIGHGYKVLGDDELYKSCIEKGIHFEVCPLSSFLTASVPCDFRIHPAVRFMEDGLSFSLNTDDPGVQQSTLDDEYEIATTSFNFTLEQFKKLNIAALQAAFVDEETKKKLIEEFEAEFAALSLSSSLAKPVEN